MSFEFYSRKTKDEGKTRVTVWTRVTAVTLVCFYTVMMSSSGSAMVKANQCLSASFNVYTLPEGKLGPREKISWNELDMPRLEFKPNSRLNQAW